ncbi:hypothetical protein QBC35DRAFT_457275 [Podospora australis]|uniref:Uncharacterized protein n=1 Tax=Podospora australis TaxID=1536484 RepID=A0AAN6WID7_9PEZI|nr:hypothetical protein QBC35DRAFT_457275 [Podospora australis]
MRNCPGHPVATGQKSSFQHAPDLTHTCNKDLQAKRDRAPNRTSTFEFKLYSLLTRHFILAVCNPGPNYKNPWSTWCLSMRMESSADILSASYYGVRIDAEDRDNDSKFASAVQGSFARKYREAAVCLATDLLRALELNLFPSLQRPMHEQQCAILGEALDVYNKLETAMGHTPLSSLCSCLLPTSTQQHCCGEMRMAEGQP